MRCCWVLCAALAVLLAVVCSPDPQLVFGAWLGRHVKFARSGTKLLFFMKVVPPTALHPQLAVLEHIVHGMKEYRSQATPGSKEDGPSNRDAAEKVMELIDTWAWQGNALMNIGDVKGKILDGAILARKKPVKLAVELGTFIGYGTVRVARLLAQDAEMITVDPCPMAYSVSTSIMEQAGLRSRITSMQDYSDGVLRRLAEQKKKKKIDLLFIDHLKHLYLPDLQLALKLGLLAEDATVVGDNIVFPGAPDFKQYLLSDEGRARFETVIHDTHCQNMPESPDQVTVNTYLH